MNLKAIIPSFIVLAAGAAPLQAGPRTSANYNIITDALDAGGRYTSSVSYTNDGSMGGIIGISTRVAPDEIVKHGYIAQLYEPSGLTLTGASMVNENASTLLSAYLGLDDGTFLTIPRENVAWSVISGAITSINANGLATTATVFENTLAVAQGIYGGFTGAFSLTVLDNIPDNFGSYAGDGLGDDWQVQYFGQNNPNAAPLLDPDGDGQSNAFEFIAGLVPTDPASRFVLTISDIPGQSTWKKLTFRPRLADRTYTVKAKANLLTGSYLPLTNPSAPTDSGPDGQTRAITDLNAVGGMKFYRVEITKP